MQTFMFKRSTSLAAANE